MTESAATTAGSNAVLLEKLRDCGGLRGTEAETIYPRFCKTTHWHPCQNRKPRVPFWVPLWVRGIAAFGDNHPGYDRFIPVRSCSTYAIM